MKRIICIVAALLLLLACFTGCQKAPESPRPWYPAMAEYLGADEAAQQQLAPACDFPDVTVQQDGVEITVLQTVMDGHAVYVLYQIQAEGLEEAPGFQGLRTNLGQQETFGCRQVLLCYPYAAVPYPTSTSTSPPYISSSYGPEFTAVDPENGLFIVQLSPRAGQRILPGGVLLEFQDLATQAGVDGTLDTVKLGTWDVAWPLKFENVALRMTTEPMEIRDVSCPGLTIDVTPLAVTVITQAKLPEDITMEVHMEDGTSYSASFAEQHLGSMFSFDSGYKQDKRPLQGATDLDLESSYSRMYLRFPQAVDVSQVKQVVLGGQAVAFSGQPLPQDFVVLVNREIPLGTTELDLSYNGMTDSEAEPLRAFPQLISLNLETNRLTDVSFLEVMPDLEYLNLLGSKIQDFTPISQLKHLKHLDLGITGVSDLHFLEGMTSLEVLRLGGNQITDISPLAELKNLRELYLNGNPVEDLSVLDTLPNLEKVELEAW